MNRVHQLPLRPFGKGLERELESARVQADEAVRPAYGDPEQVSSLHVGRTLVPFL